MPLFPDQIFRPVQVVVAAMSSSMTWQLTRGRPLLSRLITRGPHLAETDERQGKAGCLAEGPEDGIPYGPGALLE